MIYREERIGNQRLILGDCLEVLPTLEAGSVDAVVTDPPFGIAFDRATWADDPDQYPKLIKWLVAEANRVTDGGAVFIWQAEVTWPHWHEWFPPEARIFAACKGFVQFRPVPVQYSWDPVVFWGSIDAAPQRRRLGCAIGLCHRHRTSAAGERASSTRARALWS